VALAVRSEFFQDVHQDLERTLIGLGVNMPDASGESHFNGKVRLLCTELFHQIRRRIPREPRQVLWSNELRLREWVGDERQAVEKIEGELSRGDDVTPRLTTSDRRQLFLPVVLPHVRMLPECLIEIAPAGSC
jgi:hypothetical protein